MQAIFTKYLPGGNARGSRIVAWCDAGRVVIGYPHGASDPFAVAAAVLRDQLGWTEANGHAPMYKGGAPDKGSTARAVFVFAEPLARVGPDVARQR